MEISEINPDGNVYQLKDVTARTEIAQIKTQETYSTEETDTGKTWINGKTIYRKCGQKTGLAANTTIVLDATLTTSYIDDVINVHGSVINPSNDKVGAGQYSPTETARYVFAVTQTGLRWVSTQQAISKANWIIEYTKA